MNVDYINPFIHGAQNILNAVYGANPALGSLFLKKVPYTSDVVAIKIGILGDVKGWVVYTMKKDMACSIVSHMMGGMPVPDLDDMSISAICELGNMISGNVATLFSNDGKVVDITPPNFKLNSISQDYPEMVSGVPIVCVPLVFQDKSIFEVDIYIKE